MEGTIRPVKSGSDSGHVDLPEAWCGQLEITPAALTWEWESVINEVL